MLDRSSVQILSALTHVSPPHACHHQPSHAITHDTYGTQMTHMAHTHLIEHRRMRERVRLQNALVVEHVGLIEQPRGLGDRAGLHEAVGGA